MARVSEVLSIMALALFGLALFCFTVSIRAASDPPTPTPLKSAGQKQSDAPKGEQSAATKQRGAEQSPVVIEVLPAEPTKEQAERGTYEHHEKASNERLIAWATVALAIITLGLAIFTALLWWWTRELAIEAKANSDRQARDTRDSIAVAKQAANAAQQSAAAAIKSVMPILYPFVTNAIGISRTNGHPYVDFVFENYGKTPAIIREVRAELILGRESTLPDEINFAELDRPHDHEAMIPGDVRGDAAKLPGSEVKVIFRRRTTEEETAAIQAEVKTRDGKRTPYMRFHLVGRVIYDDFFGIRYTDCFCIKIRANGFQSPKGGPRFNSRTAEAAPKENDPFA